MDTPERMKTGAGEGDGPKQCPRGQRASPGVQVQMVVVSSIGTSGGRAVRKSSGICLPLSADTHQQHPERFVVG